MRHNNSRPLVATTCLLISALLLVLVAEAEGAGQLPPRLPGRFAKTLVERTDPQRLWHDTQRIAIERVADTPGNAAVRDFLVSQFRSTTGGLSQQWNVEIDEFQSDTPLGKKTFRNIIATWNCEAPERLVLAAHYDSKYFPAPRSFVGATDSAAPCALLLDIVRSLDSHLSCPAPTNTGLQVVFFDGEEAFGHWTHTDSIYGARHLASRWAADGSLNSISLLVLLDLIGAANPRFQSFWANTDNYFGRLRAIENSLKNSLNGTKNYFQSKTVAYGGIEDDHLPFLQRGVSILHLICSPFPRVWHTDSDNLDAIHLPTLADISAIMRVFIAELMGVRDNTSEGKQQAALHSSTVEVVS